MVLILWCWRERVSIFSQHSSKQKFFHPKAEAKRVLMVPVDLIKTINLTLIVHLSWLSMQIAFSRILEAIQYFFPATTPRRRFFSQVRPLTAFVTETSLRSSSGIDKLEWLVLIGYSLSDSFRSLPLTMRVSAFVHEHLVDICNKIPFKWFLELKITLGFKFFSWIYSS